MRLGLNAVPQYGGLSSDLVVNACSSLDAFRQGFRKLRSGGRFCLFSGFPDAGEASASLLNEVHYRQLKVVGLMAVPADKWPLPGYHTGSQRSARAPHRRARDTGSGTVRLAENSPRTNLESDRRILIENHLYKHEHFLLVRLVDRCLSFIHCRIDRPGHWRRQGK